MSDFDAIRSRIAAVALKQAKLSPDRADDLGVLLASLTSELRAFAQFSMSPDAPNMKVVNAIVERLCKRADVLAAASRILDGATDPADIRLAADLRPASPRFPSVALGNLRWSLVGAPFAGLGEFISAVTAQQKESGADVDWGVEEVVLPAPSVDIQYFYFDADQNYLEPTITLTSPGGAGFRAGELLHLIHNTMVDQVRECDHHFFEGIQLVSESSATGRPLYRVRQGS